MKLELPESLVNLCKNAGAPVYVVGGYVRNALCGLGKTDIDICGPFVATALTLPKDARVRMVNFRLGTSIISYMGQEYEYTPFRIEKYAEGGAHTPTEIFFTTDIVADANRRDFTAGSVYYDVNNDKFIDFNGGILDIERRVLRAKNPEKIFEADGLRILRLVRIAAETGFKIDADTAKVAMAHAEYLHDLAPERIAQELDKILVADTKYGTAGAHYRAIKLLYKMGLFPYIIPQVKECENIPQNPAYHKYDVLEHTFQCVKYADPSVRLAALFHDLGKAYCYHLYKNMYGHELISANIVREALGQNGLKYSKQIINETAKLCLNHMYDMGGITSESKVKLFIAKNYDIIHKLTLLMQADKMATGKVEELVPHRFSVIEEKMIQENAPLHLNDLQIDGNIIAGIGFEGKQVGETLEKLWNECIINPKINNSDWLTSAAQKLFDKLPPLTKK